LLDQLMNLPAGAAVELRAPVFKVYGEDFNFLASEIRKHGYRRMLIDGKPVDISEDREIDETRDHEMEVVIDKFVIDPKAGFDKQLLTGIANALMLGEQFLKVHIVDGPKK